MPSGFVRNSASPGRAPLFGQIPSGCTVPTTASPYFGSSSRIVWPPASIAPAARTTSSAPARTSPSTSVGSSSGNAAIDSASSGTPAHREHVVERVRRRDRAEVPGIVDERREEVDGEDERALVVEPVHGRVVGRVEPDEEIRRLGRHEPREQLLEPRRRVLRGAAAGLRQRGQRRRFGHTASVRPEGVDSDAEHPGPER